jgi:tetratricopeptide (TPR) repeat protein
MHAQSARLQGDLDGAAALFAESLALNRSIGDAGMVGVELHNLGQVELRRGNVDEAERLFAEAGAYAGDDPYDVGMATFVAAAVAHARGDDERAAGLLAEADEVFRRAGIEPAADDAAELEWLRAVLARRP